MALTDDLFHVVLNRKILIAMEEEQGSIACDEKRSSPRQTTEGAQSVLDSYLRQTGVPVVT